MKQSWIGQREIKAALKPVPVNGPGGVSVPEAFIRSHPGTENVAPADSASDSVWIRRRSG